MTGGIGARRILQAAAGLAFGQAGQQAVTLLRNILLARLLGPEDFGIAVTFALTVAAVTMVSDFGIEQFLIRSPRGDEPGVQATLHLLTILRGVVIAAGIVALAAPAAALFGHPGLAPLYGWLALVPLLRGFMHLDMRRVQRRLVFGPSITADLGSLAVGTVVAVGLGLLLRSHEAAFWAALAEAASVLVLSHRVAVQRYRIGFHAELLPGLFRYGWPLTLNGVVLFAAGQGDRILVGALEGVADLAGYAAVGALTGGASVFLMKLTGALYTPLLAGMQHDPLAFVQRNRRCGLATLLASLGMTLLVVLWGAEIVVLLFGEAYAVAPVLAGWLALQAGMRVLRAWPVTVTLAGEATQDILTANLIRLLGLGLAAAALAAGGGVVGVACAMAVGETGAGAFALWRMDRGREGPRGPGAGIAALAAFGGPALAGLAAMSWAGGAGMGGFGMGERALLGAGLLVAGPAAFLALVRWRGSGRSPGR